MKKRSRGREKSPQRKPIDTKKPIIGMVWSIPSWEIAESMIPEIEQRIDQDQTKCGVAAYAFFTGADKENSYVILLGIGSMFNPNFVALIGSCVQRHKGERLPESQRTKKLINESFQAWQNVKHEQIDIKRLIRRVARGW